MDIDARAAKLMEQCGISRHTNTNLASLIVHNWRSWLRHCEITGVEFRQLEIIIQNYLDALERTTLNRAAQIAENQAALCNRDIAGDPMLSGRDAAQQIAKAIREAAK